MRIPPWPLDYYIIEYIRKRINITDTWQNFISGYLPPGMYTLELSGSPEGYPLLGATDAMYFRVSRTRFKRGFKGQYKKLQKKYKGEAAEPFLLFFPTEHHRFKLNPVPH